MGDFHTLVIAEDATVPINDDFEEPDKSNGATNLYAWGFNIHG